MFVALAAPLVGLPGALCEAPPEALLQLLEAPPTPGDPIVAGAEAELEVPEQLPLPAPPQPPQPNSAHSLPPGPISNLDAGPGISDRAAVLRVDVRALGEKDASTAGRHEASIGQGFPRELFSSHLNNHFTQGEFVVSIILAVAYLNVPMHSILPTSSES